ncbi:MAG TPA: PH domain-containing protein [Patescibacteria group bacterium]|nr:PH domain-containing protein [Patescibacteria group bacterium]
MIRLDQLPNQRPNEKVRLVLRRCWVTPFEILFYVGLLYAVLAAGVIGFFPQLTVLLGRPVLGPLTTMGLSVYALGVWLFGFTEFVDYYLDVWIVTNERVLSVEQKGLFTRVASELHLSTVQDVTSEVKGMLRTVLNYGDVHIQTAAERIRFIFKGVPHPERVREQIVALVEENRQKQVEK